MAHAGPLLLIVAPLLAVPLLWVAARRGPAAMGAVVVGAAGLTFAGVVALTPAVLAHGAVTTHVPAVLEALRFTLDGVGLLFALVVTFLWTCASLYAIDYLHHDGRERRYHLTSLLTLAAMLGVVMAGDLITLYLFFEWLGLAAYLFVVHTGTPAAERAGLKYLVLTLLGGFSVLTGVLLVHGLGGGDIGVPLALEPGAEGVRLAAAVFLVLGFGVKAGMLGLHIWLPDAHTAAPAPASALLSGLMIKAGAYGILRTVGGLFGGTAAASPAAALQGEQLALAVLLVGTVTMFAGVVMALWQHEAKRLLAYSSVSQMGFILVGIGAAGYLGGGGGIGWTGALLHVANHALFKGLLFLGIGAVIHATGVGDLRRLGGVARHMPWTFAFVLVAAGGIAGVPGLNGFVSKSVLHHALEYAEAHRHLVVLAWAERVFTLTTVGTAAALTKLLAMTFLGRPRAELAKPTVEAAWGMRGAMGALAAMVVVLGVRPQAAAPVLAAAQEAFGLSGASVERWVSSPLGHAGDLRAALTALALGALVHLIASRTRAYDHPPPAWLSLDRMLLAAIGAGAVAVRWLAAERAALETAARQLFEHERDVLLEAAAHPPVAARRSWLRLRVSVLALATRASAHWQAAERLTRELGRRLDETRRLDENRRLAREAEAVAAASARDATLGAAHLAAEAAAADAAPVVADQEYLMLATRRRIQRDTRDLSLNVGVLFLVWLAFLATVWLAAV